jgi:hypothetical protein
MPFKVNDCEYVAKVNNLLEPLGLEISSTLRYIWNNNGYGFEVSESVSFNFEKMEYNKILPYVLKKIFEQGIKKGKVDLKRENYKLWSFNEDEESEFGKI